LDERGIVRKRDLTGDTYVRKGDVIVGKTLTKSNKSNDEEVFDCSYMIKDNEEGYVDRIIETVTPSGYKMVKVIIRSPRFPEMGDKFSSRSAQKGTCILGDSLVVMKSGISKQIKDVEEGDVLWGYNGSGLTTSACLKKAYMGDKETITITFGTGDVLTCTPDHRILTDKGWKEAIDLGIDDLIASFDKKYKGCEDVEIPFCYTFVNKIEKSGVKPVYDITVDKLESFIANGIIVHNCGLIMYQEDMPFSQTGMCPDIIINANCIPSRMTVAQLLESVLGKTCAINGTFGDATPFSSNSVDIAEKLCNDLEKTGFERHGYETLYSGFTGEPIEAQIMMGPTFYQRLKHLVSEKIHCLAIDGTEVLTLDGWKTVYQLTKEDLVATLNDEKLVYEKPNDIMIYEDYEGPIYHVENQGVDLTVTGNHRMWVSKSYGRKRSWLPYEFKRADEIVGKEVRYKKDAIWEAIDYQFVLEGCIKYVTPTFNKEIFDKNVEMDDWLIFFGIWYAEGWASGRETSGRIQFAVNKQRVKDALYPALEKMGYKFNVVEEKLTIYDYQLYRYMSLLSVGAPNKKLPEWVFNLSVRQTQILIKGMLLGDGSSNKSSGCEFYYTSSKILADQFQQLCLHAGWTGNITTHIKAYSNNNQIKGKPIITHNDVLRISVIKKRLNPTVNHGHEGPTFKESLKDEKCPVFCLQVPSQVFYVRRNGKGVWTGNSRAQGHVTTLHKGGNRQMLVWLSKIPCKINIVTCFLAGNFPTFNITV